MLDLMIDSYNDLNRYYNTDRLIEIEMRLQEIKRQRQIEDLQKANNTRRYSNGKKITARVARVDDNETGMSQLAKELAVITEDYSNTNYYNYDNYEKITPYIANVTGVEIDQETGKSQLAKELAVIEGSVF
jgi:hypothetical protein